MSAKPVLYTFGLSVWAAVPELAIAELYPEGAVDTKTINLVEGENFHPTFLEINPHGTLPTLTVEGKAYTSTADVTGYLVKHAPKPVKAGNRAFIEKIHEDQYDPNFAMLLARSEDELKAKAAGFPMTFVSNRQEALAKYAATCDATSLTGFYRDKTASNGGLLSIYKGEAPAEATQGFIKQSQSVWSSISGFVTRELPEVLPASGFIGGTEPGEDDYHVGAWLARICSVVGVDNAAGLEKETGNPVPEKLLNYWRNWVVRPSWKKVYAAGLH